MNLICLSTCTRSLDLTSNGTQPLLSRNRPLASCAVGLAGEPAAPMAGTDQRNSRPPNAPDFRHRSM